MTRPYGSLRRRPPAETGVQPLGREAWIALGTGLGIAIVVLAVPFLRFLFLPLLTLVHELGHTIFYWLFGYTAIPAFDFQYGGGVTIHPDDRSLPVLVLVYAALAGALYYCRRHRVPLAVMITATVVYTLCAFTTLHEILEIVMGHGTELCFAGIFLYRCASGSAVTVAAERPLYGFVGFYILLMDVGFAWGLATSAAARADYGEAKGGGHWMDFSRLARDYFHVELTTVAWGFLIACVLPLAGSLLFYRYRRVLAEQLTRWLNR